MRQLLAVSAAAGAAAVGALITGEYQLVGWVALVAGVLFGVAVAEVLAVVGNDARPPMLVAAAAVSAAGLGWGLWISTGRDLGFATAAGWTAVAVGALTSPAWLRSAARRGPRSSTGS